MNNDDYPLAVRVRMDVNPCAAGLGHASPAKTGPPALLIRWRDEWPDINEVPLAGETVWWTHNKKPYTVETGIPYRRAKNGPWLVNLLTVAGKRTHRQTSELTRTPPVEKVTGVRVGTLHASGMAYGTEQFHAMERIPPGTYAIVRVEDTTDDT